MNIDKRIERKKKTLNAAIKIKGVMSSDVLILSQQLDVLIVRRIRRALA